MKLELKIKWKGPFTVEKVIDEKNDGGNPPDFDGEDYGIYQIYGHHILNGDKTLVYVGKATKQMFSTRFKQHKKWIEKEEKKDKIRVYLGRAHQKPRHSKKDDWAQWLDDMDLAEKLIINKYSPNYNSSSISRAPKLGDYKKIVLKHTGDIGDLEEKDIAPDDLI